MPTGPSRNPPSRVFPEGLQTTLPRDSCVDAKTKGFTSQTSQNSGTKCHFFLVVRSEQWG